MGGSSLWDRVPCLEEAECPLADVGDLKGIVYAAAVKERLDKLGLEKNCRELQREFDQAEKNGPATMQRTGSNTADLMKYIDELMRTSGCYR